MEHYIINVTDITYLSELTHTPSQQKRMAMDFWVWGLIRPNNLRSVSCGLINKEVCNG